MRVLRAARPVGLTCNYFRALLCTHCNLSIPFCNPWSYIKFNKYVYSAHCLWVVGFAYLNSLRYVTNMQSFFMRVVFLFKADNSYSCTSDLIEICNFGRIHSCIIPRTFFQEYNLRVFMYKAIFSWIRIGTKLGFLPDCRYFWSRDDLHLPQNRPPKTLWRQYRTLPRQEIPK